MGGSVTKPYGPGYLVIGDAAGMVNPFNGEGIAYALETGKLAGGLLAEALRSGDSHELSVYREALFDIYGPYYRLGRRFTKVIGQPRIFRALCQVGMRSRTVMGFVFQVLANLAEEKGGKLGDRSYRALVKIAETDLPELNEPDIPDPPTKRRVEKVA
jgi:flavin-dependent dehydrogenase